MYIKQPTSSFGHGLFPPVTTFLTNCARVYLVVAQSDYVYANQMTLGLSMLRSVPGPPHVKRS